MDTPVTISAFMTGMLLTVIRGLRHLRRMLERPMAASTGNGGNDSGKQGHKQRGVNTLHDQAVVKEFLVPAQGEALPHGVALAGVEGEDNKNEDRRV